MQTSDTELKWRKVIDDAFAQGKPMWLVLEEVNQKSRTDALNEVENSLHEIYSQSLYCREDYHCPPEGPDCDDCLYCAMDKSIKRIQNNN